MLRAVAVALAVTGCGPILGIESTVLEEPETCPVLAFRIYFADKPVADTTVAISMPTAEQFAGLYDQLDASRGHVLAGVTDCADNLLDDAALELTPLAEARAFTIDDSGVQLANDTSEPGHAGFFNVDTNTELKLFAKPEVLGNVASSVGDLEAAAGVMSYVLLFPNSEITMGSGSGDLSCVGNVPAPVVDEATIRITVEVNDSPRLDPARGQPRADVSVRACPDDDECGEIARTDGAGIAAVNVGSGTEGFDGHLRVGCD